MEEQIKRVNTGEHVTNAENLLLAVVACYNIHVTGKLFNNDSDVALFEAIQFFILVPVLINWFSLHPAFYLLSIFVGLILLQFDR